MYINNYALEWHTRTLLLDYLLPLNIFPSMSSAIDSDTGGVLLPLLAMLVVCTHTC